MPKNIRQQVRLNAVPGQIYDALMESKLHAKFTGAKAAISKRVGGTFNVHGGYIQGVNLELVPGKRIVQAWRGKNWPQGAWSTVTYQLEKLPGGRTLLTFTQSGVPTRHAASIRSGWKTEYWKPLKSWLHGLQNKATGKKKAKKKTKRKAKKKTAAKKKKKATKKKTAKKKTTKKRRR